MVKSGKSFVKIVKIKIGYNSTFLYILSKFPTTPPPAYLILPNIPAPPPFHPYAYLDPPSFTQDPRANILANT